MHVNESFKSKGLKHSLSHYYLRFVTISRNKIFGQAAHRDMHSHLNKLVCHEINVIITYYKPVNRPSKNQRRIKAT